ncbi:hypothetical protein P5V15_013086 [Pogonomyrmex californicus]
MEKKGLRKKDILRMDGLLPPTRRLPVCDAIPSASDKKKDKKWSIGGILRRISSIRDYESSSNDEEIVYCKRTPRRNAKFNRQADGVVLHTVENNLEHDKRVRAENNFRHATDSPHSRRDSLHSRSSDGSLDGLGKKHRRNKLKARTEAKRDHLCAASSSDEDCRRSNNSLNRFHTMDSAQNGQKSNICSRRTRAARTERYIKRLSRDEGNGSGDTLNDCLYNKRCSIECIEDKGRVVYADTNGLCRPPIHPRRSGAYSNNRVFPIQRSSAENLRDVDRANLPHSEIFGDVRRYSTGRYITDLNQNNTYGKISRNLSSDVYTDSHRNFFTYPAKNACHYSEPFDYAVDRRLINPDSQPPEPPPRDPRRVFGHGYSSYPTNRHQNVPNYFNQDDNRINIANGISRPDWRNFRSYGSNNEIASRRDTMERGLENSMLNFKTDVEFRNSLERINNKYNASRHCANESAYKETEATRRRNTRNDQLNRNDANYCAYKVKNKSMNICEMNKHHDTISSHASAASSDWSGRSSGRSPCEQRISRSITPCDVDNHVEGSEKERGIIPTEEAQEKRRSSKNLEEALSELEAIYNSLRLGDEDLLDRAERRSMEEFHQKQEQSKSVSLDAMSVITPDSPDRTKDDMAYRRMHPKERPTSLSDIAGQSTLSSISYLITSPVLSGRDSADDLVRLPLTCPSRRDEPDVTRDDVVFRSISHANNTLRIIDPQPPFGIPLGPVTTATESDYLHTTPTKPEQPRSPYIPQCEPDVVTDDLAYRALRKDAVVTRNVTESKLEGASKEQPVVVNSGMKKKRAVRSLSANLYGLINHDRIHLRREPSLDAIKDEIQDVTRNFAATPERPEYLRRVVSDGELFDNDAHRWKELAVKGDIDINGNHPAVGAYRKKVCVYVSPEMMTTTTRESPKKEKKFDIAELSDAMLSSKAILDDGFWQEYLRPDSNTSAANSGRSTETDFTAYSRLCQDLVNLIKDDGDATSPIKSPNTDDPIIAIANKSDDFNVKLEVDEPSVSIHIRSLGSHYSGSRQTARANEERNVESEKTESSTDSNSAKSSSELTPAPNNLDFYLRVADENVKLIAEAFGDVADRLRDSRLSACKNSSASRNSEIEDQSGSTRSSSTPYQDEPTSEDRPTVTPKLQETARVMPSRDSFTSNEGDPSDASHLQDDAATANAELDLSRAVRDLQLAAASLYEHGQEIEDLSTRRRRIVRDVAPIAGDAAVATSTNEIEDGAIRKINLIADDLRQERERDQEEAVVLPSGIEARDTDARRGGSREGLQALVRSQ